MNRCYGLLILAVWSALLSGCATSSIWAPLQGAVLPVSVPQDAIVLPKSINQAEWTPPASRQNDYSTQSMLYTEFGARMYNREDLIDARKFFEFALKYDNDNEKALFCTAMLDWREGKYKDMIPRLKAIKQIDKPLYPYEIDYYKTAQMILSSFPISAKVISLSRNDRINAADNVVVVNKGLANGLRIGMGLNIYRIGNPIRDFDSLEILGVQKSGIAHVTVTDISDKNAVCKIDSTEANYFIQINDIVESDFGGAK